MRMGLGLALSSTTGEAASGDEPPTLTFSTGLTRVSNTITANLSTGIAGSQSVIGGTAASETLTLSSTADATKGKILFGTSAYDEVNNRLGIGTASPSTRLEVRTDALGTTQVTTAGLALVNETAAAAGAQQISPAIRWKGYGWKTTATAASQSVEFRADVLPVQGTSAPTGSLRFQSSINGGAFTDLVNISSSGNLSANSLTSIQLTGTAAGRMGIVSVFGMALTVPNTNGLYIGNSAADVGAEAKVKIVGDNTTSTGVNGVLSMTQTWNTSTNPVTAIKLNVTNTSSHAAALLMDLQVGSTSMFNVDKAGAVTSLYQRFGSGSPEGVVTAPVGAVYHRTDGGAGISFYVKESGTGNTGWVAK